MLLVTVYITGEGRELFLYPLRFVAGACKLNRQKPNRQEKNHTHFIDVNIYVLWGLAENK